MAPIPPLIFERQDFLFLFAFLPVFWFVQRRALRSVFSFLSFLLHSLVLSLIILALAGFAMLKPGANTVPLLMVDLSRSLTVEQRQWMHDTIVQILQPQGDTPTVVFAGQQQLLPWKNAEPLLTNPSVDLQLDETNLEGAFTSLLSTIYNRSVYLLSDGWETKEKVRSLTPLLTERKLKVYPFPPPPAEKPPNIAIQRLSVPQTAEGGASITASVALENTNRAAVQGELVVRQGEKEVWRQNITLPPGASLLSHALTLSGDGLIPLRATITSQRKTEDFVAQDNQAVAWVTMAPREKVLLVGARARDNRYLEQALDNRGFDVVAEDFASISSSVPDLDSFSVVILNNIARDRLPSSFFNGIDPYVRQGGGLLMIGGEESLGLGGYKGSSLEKVLPVSLVPPQKPERSTAMVLVIDTSGSMRRDNKLLYAKEGVRAVARNLKDTDMLGIIGFDREPFVVIPLQPLSRIRGDIDYRIERLMASGGTFLLPALEEARRQLTRQPAARKQVVILTDGETGGSGGEYVDLVSVMHREAKITVSSIALGEEANLRLMSRIADYGGGAFHHTTDPSSLPELFLDQMEENKEEKTMVEKNLTPLPNPDSPLLKDVKTRDMPSIKGYVETQLKSGARMDIALRSDGQRPPLLASWTYGKGKAVVFTSDANGRWSAPWVDWDGFSALWSRVVRWCLPEVTRKETHFSVELGHNESGLVVNAFSYGASEEGRTASAKIEGPNKAERLSLERLAPGHYQGALIDPQAGDYRVEVTLPSGEKIGPLGYTVPPRRVGETPQPQPNFPLLEDLASATGGSVNPDVTTIIQPTSPPEPQPLLPYLIPLAMALYFLELLVRRLV